MINKKMETGTHQFILTDAVKTKEHPHLMGIEEIIGDEVKCIWFEGRTACEKVYKLDELIFVINLP